MSMAPLKKIKLQDHSGGQADSSESDSSEQEEETTGDDGSSYYVKRKESPLMFERIPTDEEIESEFESVEVEFLDVLKAKVELKQKQLYIENKLLNDLEKIRENQAHVILKLTEKVEAMKLEAMQKRAQENILAESMENSVVPEETPLVVFDNPAEAEEELEKVIQTVELGNLEPTHFSTILQLFSLALYYFSPNTFEYLQSFMKSLPSKSLLQDWVKSGHFRSILPPGLVLNEKKFFD